MNQRSRRDFRSRLASAIEGLRSALVLVVIVAAFALPAYAFRGAGGVVLIIMLGCLVAIRFR